MQNLTICKGFGQRPSPVAFSLTSQYYDDLDNWESLQADDQKHIQLMPHCLVLLCFAHQEAKHWVLPGQEGRMTVKSTNKQKPVSVSFFVVAPAGISQFSAIVELRCPDRQIFMSSVTIKLDCVLHTLCSWTLSPSVSLLICSVYTARGGEMEAKGVLLAFASYMWKVARIVLGLNANVCIQLWNRVSPWAQFDI